MKGDRFIHWCNDASETDVNEILCVPRYVTQEGFEDCAEKAGGFVRLADLLKDSKSEFSKN